MNQNDSTGTAPQEAQADPQMVTCFQCRGDGTCFATDDPCPVCGGLGSITDDPVAPVPQTEGEDKAAQLKRNLIAMGYTDDQAQEIATRLALKGGHA